MGETKRDRISPSSLNEAGTFTIEAFTRTLTLEESRLDLLSQQCRDHIKAIVDHLLLHEQDTPLSKAVWTWAVTLGTLAWDVSGSALLLFGFRDFRAGKILSRALVDYAIRLEYYTYDPDKALEDFKNAPTSLWKFIRPNQALASDNSDWPAIKAFLHGDNNLIKRQTSQMMRRNFEAAAEDPTRVTQMIEYMYDREYGIGSALAHGNQGSIWDVFADLTGEAKLHQWHSRGVHSSTLAFNIAQATLSVVRGLTFIIQQTEEYERLFSEMDKIVKSAAAAKGPDQ